MASIKVELLGDSTSLERAFARAARSSGQLKIGLGSVIKTTAAIVGVTAGVRGLADVLTSSVSASGDFQLALQKTVGLSGVAQSAIAGLRKEVLQLGPAVGKSPQELADALFFITSSGIPAAKALDVLTVSAKASAAGLGETQVVADAVTSALNAYGPAVLNATQATDVLVATVREGKGEADQFAGVIGNVAALASQLGVSFNEVGAALAAQTRLGTDAETSATQLQRVFTTLLKVTPASAKAFAAVGLNADKLRADLGSKGLLNVLQQVKDAFPKDPKLLAKAFGDQRAIRGVLALVGKQADSVRGIFERLAQSTGSLKTAFGAVSKTQAQQFAKLNASLQVFKITLGAALAPAILKVVGPLNRWLSVTKNQERVQRDIRETVKAVVGGLHDLVDILTPVAQQAKNASDAVGGFKNAVKLLVAAFLVFKTAKIALTLDKIVTQTRAIGTAADVSAGKVGKLQKVLLGLLFSPEFAIPAAIAAIGAGVVLGSKSQEFAKSPKPVQASALNRLPESVSLKLIAGLTKAQRDALIPFLKKLDNTALVNVIKHLDATLGATKIPGDRGPGSVTNNPNNRGPTTTGGTGGGGKGGGGTPQSFSTRLTKLFQTFDLALAKAQLTASSKDDLAVLRSQLAVVNALLAKHKKNLDLQSKQVDLQGQINSLQKQQADTLAGLAVARAGLTPTKSDDFKVLTAQLAVVNKQLKADRDNLELQQKQVDLQGQIKDIQQSARDDQKSLFGSLFGKADSKLFPTLLGGGKGKIVPGTGNTAHDALSLITAQNKAFATLTTNIAKLVKEGAPASLIKAARAGEISPEQVAAIAGASPKIRNRIFGQVRRADKLIANAAKTEITAKTVTLNAGTVKVGAALSASGGHGPAEPGVTINGGVHLHGVQNVKQMEAALERRAKKRASQRRGRTGGKR